MIVHIKTTARTTPSILRRILSTIGAGRSRFEALQIWERENGAFDLLFTDMTMPGGISGLDLHKRLKEKKTDLLTVISSGYNLETLDTQNIATGEVTLLHKPYNIATLATTIRLLFDKKS